jgi:hypothetical protein
MIGLDLIGPLPKIKKGHDNLLVTVDYFSKWVCLYPLRSAKTRMIAEHLITMCCQYGFPDAVLSDNGPQFVSEIYENMWRSVSSKPKHTTPYHPQTNLTEQVNRTIVTQLRMYVDGHHTDWDARLREL